MGLVSEKCFRRIVNCVVEWMVTTAADTTLHNSTSVNIGHVQPCGRKRVVRRQLLRDGDRVTNRHRRKPDQQKLHTNNRSASVRYTPNTDTTRVCTVKHNRATASARLFVLYSLRKRMWVLHTEPVSKWVPPEFVIIRIHLAPRDIA